jgi:hypothetical protein
MDILAALVLLLEAAKPKGIEAIAKFLPIVFKWSKDSLLEPF